MKIKTSGEITGPAARYACFRPAMHALRPIMERSQETLRAFYASGGHLAGSR
jgi:hypothetical protein